MYIAREGRRQGYKRGCLSFVKRQQSMWLFLLSIVRSLLASCMHQNRIELCFWLSLFSQAKRAWQFWAEATLWHRYDGTQAVTGGIRTRVLGLDQASDLRIAGTSSFFSIQLPQSLCIHIFEGSKETIMQHRKYFVYVCAHQPAHICESLEAPCAFYQRWPCACDVSACLNSFAPCIESTRKPCSTY